MASIENLRKLSADARAQWKASELSVPRCPLEEEEHIQDLATQIGKCLEAAAKMGTDNATLIVRIDDTQDTLSVYFHAHTQKLVFPGVFWGWWREITDGIPRLAVETQLYLAHKEAIRTTRRSQVRSAIYAAVTRVGIESRMPTAETVEVKNGTWRDLQYTFDWEEKK